jgi:ABC-type phosphate transport system substrate-binding protein
VTRRTNQRKTNGYAGPHGHTNGHAPASTKRGGIPVQRDRAASDDTRRASVAKDASSASAPGTDCEAYAEAAPPRLEKKNGKMQKNDKQNGKQNAKHGGQRDESLKKFLLAGPTEFAAMQDGAAYVNSIAGRVDLVGASVRLLGSTDEKIAKAELDRLRDMKFGKGPVTVIEEVPRVETGDMPRPLR